MFVPARPCYTFPPSRVPSGLVELHTMISIRRRTVAAALAATAVTCCASMRVSATPVIETSISSFEGKEEPTVLYHPSTGSFTNDSYVNMTDQGGGIVRFTLRYHPDQDWWDGDRNTTNNDRQRAEVKGLGPHQSPGDVFEYAMDFR